MSLKPKPRYAEKEPEPTPPDYTDIKVLRKSDFRELVLRHRSAAAKEKVAAKEKDEVKEEILALMIGAKTDKVLVDNIPVTKAKGHKAKRIDGGLLLDQGVDPDAIVAATVGGEEYFYVLTKPPERKDERE